MSGTKVFIFFFGIFSVLTCPAAVARDKDMAGRRTLCAALGVALHRVTPLQPAVGTIISSNMFVRTFSDAKKVLACAPIACLRTSANFDKGRGEGMPHARILTGL